MPWPGRLDAVHRPSAGQLVISDSRRTGTDAPPANATTLASSWPARKAKNVTWNAIRPALPDLKTARLSLNAGASSSPPALSVATWPTKRRTRPSVVPLEPNSPARLVTTAVSVLPTTSLSAVRKPLRPPSPKLSSRMKTAVFRPFAKWWRISPTGVNRPSPVTI